MSNTVFAKLKGLCYEMDLGLGCHAWIDIYTVKLHFVTIKHVVMSFKL
jgi:hypothetical protein